MPGLDTTILRAFVQVPFAETFAEESIGSVETRTQYCEGLFRARIQQVTLFMDLFGRVLRIGAKPTNIRCLNYLESR
jgi:hypothetical protein